MKKNLLCLVVLLLMLLLACAPFGVSSPTNTPTPEPTTGSISGKVIDSANGAPMPSASISTDPPTSAVTTDEHGTYSISEIPPGGYTVVAVKAGYTNTSVQVTVLKGKTTTADLHLGTAPSLTDDLDEGRCLSVHSSRHVLTSGSEATIILPSTGVYTVTGSGRIYNSSLEFDSVILRYRDDDARLTRYVLVGDGESTTITPNGGTPRIQAFVIDTSEGKHDNTGTMQLTFSKPGVSRQLIVNPSIHALTSGSEAAIILPSAGVYTVTGSGHVHNSPLREFDSVILRYHDQDAGFTRHALVSNGESTTITPSGESLRIQAFVVDTLSGKSDNTGAIELTFE